MSGLESFFEAVAQSNPFETDRVTPVAGRFADARELLAEPFRQIQEVLGNAHVDTPGFGIMLWGEPGIGKSHLLARLERWARAEPVPALFLGLTNLQAEPERLPRALLRGVMGLLTRTKGSRWATAPLFRVVNGMLRSALDGEYLQPHGRHAIERGFQRLLDRWTSEAPGRAALLDRSIFDVLIRFQLSALKRRAGIPDDGIAALAVRWLRGDTLESDEARRLGLPPAPDRDEGVALADDEQIKRVLVALAQASWCWGRPMVLALDQVDNLEPAQFRTLARFLHALLDSATNLVVITAGVKQTLLEWHSQQVVQDSSWDRLAQTTVDLQRLAPRECLPMVEVRLRKFLEPFAHLFEVSERTRQDGLFPLGKAWFDDFSAGRVEIRPRDVIHWASKGWQEQQAALREKGPQGWLDGWSAPRPPAPAEPLDPAELSQLVERTLRDRLRVLYEKKKDQLKPLGWDPDGLADLLRDLAGHWVQRQQWPFLLRIDRINVSGQKRPTFQLLLRQRLSATGPDLTRAVAFLLDGHGNMLTSQLRRLGELEESPNHLILVHDQKGGLHPGARGREYLEDLEREYAECLHVMPVSLEQHAELAAVQALLGECRSGEVEVALPDGSIHRVDRTEAVATLIRNDLFLTTDLMRLLLTAKAADEARADEMVVEG